MVGGTNGHTILVTHDPCQQGQMDDSKQMALGGGHPLESVYLSLKT
jgi:hypothetical protein